jgi:Ca2+-binding EF-hand superfamily protein
MIGLTVLAAAGPAAARGPAQHPRLFAALDQNKDGAVTREEYGAFRDREFARFDSNKDGAVGRDEFMAAERGHGRAAARDAQFKAINKSGSGSISKAEWDARTDALFAQRDRNKDGKLTPDEFGRRRMRR